eukprot:6197801-Pleurochrysis_carterae.AAC.1
MICCEQTLQTLRRPRTVRALRLRPLRERAAAPRAAARWREAGLAEGRGAQRGRRRPEKRERRLRLVQARAPNPFASASPNTHGRRAGVVGCIRMRGSDANTQSEVERHAGKTRAPVAAQNQEAVAGQDLQLRAWSGCRCDEVKSRLGRSQMESVRRPRA